MSRKQVTSKKEPWSKLPKGWTKKSLKKFWESLTGDRKHKVTKCIKEMEGKVTDPGAFCASLADVMKPGWRLKGSAPKKEINYTSISVQDFLMKR